MSFPFVEGVNPNFNYTLQLINRVNAKEDVNYNTINGLLALTIDGANKTTNSTTNLISQSSSNLLWSSNNEILPLSRVRDNNYIKINVKDYGAKGDGNTNDTTAINNAVSALPSNNGVLYFPSGHYVVNTTISIGSKTNLLIKCENVLITRPSTSGSFTFFITSCNGLRVCDGKLSIICSTGNDNSGFYIDSSSNITIENIAITGGITTAFNIAGCDGICKNIHIEGNTSGASSGTGIQLNLITTDRRMIFSNIQVNKLNYGFYSLDASLTLVNSSFVDNRIGCYIVGVGAGVKIEGGLISNNRFNHNTCCGVLIDNINQDKGLSILNNQFWVNTGGTFIASELSSATARATNFNLYIQNSKKIVVRCNEIGRSYVNIGLDSYEECSFINNNLSATTPTLTVNHIVEYGNSSLNNTNNVFLNNTMFGTLNPATNLNFVYFSSELGRNNVFKFFSGNSASGGSGNAGNQTTYYINANSGTHYLMFADYYIINNSVVKSPAGSTSPTSQTAIIYIPTRLIGTEFSIFFTGNTNTSEITWIRLNDTNGTITRNITIDTPIQSSVSWDNVNKSIKVLGTLLTGGIRFIPRSLTDWNWIIKSI